MVTVVSGDTSRIRPSATTEISAATVAPSSAGDSKIRTTRSSGTDVGDSANGTRVQVASRAQDDDQHESEDRAHENRLPHPLPRLYPRSAEFAQRYSLVAPAKVTMSILVGPVGFEPTTKGL